MQRLVRRRPSGATAIALVALFVALGGSAYAAARITGRDVVDRSLTYHDIAFHTIGPGEVGRLTGQNVRRSSMGGYQVDESTLSQVPTAKNADTVGGLTPKKFSVKLPATGAESTVLQSGALTLLASCSSTGVPNLRATSSVAGSELTTANTGAAGAGASGARQSGLGPGGSVDVDLGHANGSGELQLATPAGEVQTVTFGFVRSPAFGANQCAVFGTSQGG